MPSETSPLLPGHYVPLPWLPFASLLLFRFATPFMLKVGAYSIWAFINMIYELQIIFPYVAEMINEMLPEVEKAEIGYYIGWVEGCYMAGATLTVLPFSLLANRFGMKKVVIAGSTVTATFNLFFGFSTHYAVALSLRFLSGCFAGNQAVLRVLFTHLTCPENAAYAFSWFAATWSSASTLAPLAGGLLVHGHRFALERFPYSLPSVLGSTIMFLAIFLAAMGLRKDTAVGKSGQTERDKLTRYSILRLLKGQRLKIVCLWSFSLLSQSVFDAIIIVHTYNPVATGGLGLTPFQVSFLLSSFAAVTIIASLTLFQPLVGKYGTITVMQYASVCNPVVICILAFTNHVAQLQTSQLPLWCMLGAVVVIRTGASLSIASVELYSMSACDLRSEKLVYSALISIAGDLAWGLGPPLSSSLYSALVSRWPACPAIWLAFCSFGVCTSCIAWHLEEVA